MKALVLVIEGEPQIVRVLRINLRRHGYEIDIAPSGRAALAAAAQHPPALIVLGLDLPDMKGVEVIRRLRRWSRAPIIVLSGRMPSGDTVAALDAGADDYVTRPFDMEELMARLRAAARRAGDVSDIAKIRVGGHTVDLAQHTVTGPEGTVELTPMVWEILEVVVRNAGKVVCQSQLLTEVGGNSYLRQGNSLRVHMTHLRHKLESNPARPRHLRTEPGMGYRFSA
jgi:two-component system KDP operon response regulator KdpE